MIHLRRTAHRHHDRRLRREVWRTFDPVDRADPLGARFRGLEALDESRLPPRADVPRRGTGDGEVVTYVREGTVAYEDATGHVGMIHAGELQRLVTTPGARHVAANASRGDWAHVFQLRLRCASPPREPERDQKRFSAAERRGGLCVVAATDARAGALRLAADASIYSALLETGQHVVHALAPGHVAWLHVVHGELTLADDTLVAGDGAGVTSERAVSLIARADSEILLIDLPDPEALGASRAR